MIPSRADSPEETLSTDAEAAAPPKRRPVRRPSKPDAVLAAAVDFARQGLLEVVPSEQVGEHVTSYPEAERLTTHRFEADVPGYGGWQWFVTLARVPRGKEATISEVGLLPSADALLPPEWLPWSERVRPEDHDDAAAPGQPAEGQAADTAVQAAAEVAEGETAVAAPESEPTGSGLEDPGPAASVSLDDVPVDAVPVDARTVDAPSRSSSPADSAGTVGGSPDATLAGSDPADPAPSDTAPSDTAPSDTASAETVPPAAGRKRSRRVASAPAGNPFGSPFGVAPPGLDD